ncbi:hypothetical protein Q4491_00070 [Photobacterium sp. 2_MG-2023]|nr:hypothetical protein [Photobacterium sp. 2_MG-2023]MDO6579725.1 hypothetical protein [Photobacterium sp. 2_MG-2023]
MAGDTIDEAVSIKAVSLKTAGIKAAFIIDPGAKSHVWRGENIRCK